MILFKVRRLYHRHRHKMTDDQMMVLRDLGVKEISVARGINYYLGVIKGVIIGPGREGTRN